MKKKFICMGIAVLCIVSMSFVVACSGNGRSYAATYYGTYGEWFLLPRADSVSVTDADGNAVQVADGKIFLDKTGNYTVVFTDGKTKTTATLSVSAGREAAIYPSKKAVYTVVGQKTELVTATASDGVRACAVEGNMFYGEEEIDVTDGFTPAEAGVYDYVLSAVTGSGVKTQMTIPYYVELTDNFSDKIASFDKPHGLTQMGYITRRLSYSRDVAFADEDGALAMDISGAAVREPVDFCIYNLDCADVSQYDAVYCYVYNPTPTALNLYIGWKKVVSLRPGSWTRVAVDKKEYDTVLPGTYQSSMENITAHDINGLFFTLMIQRDSFVRHGDCLYFSAMRGIKAVDIKTLQAYIDACTAADALDQLTVETLDFYYRSLRSSQKAQIKGYGRIKNEYAKRQVIAAGLEYSPDKLTYFDTAYGLSQITPAFGVGSVAIDATMPFDGQATLKIRVDSNDFAFTVENPGVYELSAFDVIEIAVYNPTAETLLYYNTDGNYPAIGNVDYALLPNRWNRYLLPVCADKTIAGKTVWIRPDDWVGGGIMVGKDFRVSSIYAYTMESVLDKFLQSDIRDIGYIQSMFASYNALPAAKKTALANKVCNVYDKILAQLASADDLAAQESYAVSTLTLYTAFDTDMRTVFAENFAALYEKCVDLVLSRGEFAAYKDSVRKLLAVGNGDPSGCADAYGALVAAAVSVRPGDTAIALDTPLGKDCVVDLYGSATAAYTTDMHYGDEAGSTVYTVTAEAGYCDFGVNAESIDFFSGQETLEFYVYYQSDETDSDFQPTFWYRYYPYGSAIDETFKACNLTVNDWTKVTVPLNGQTQIQDWVFVVMNREWENLHQGDRIYFSAVRVGTLQ